MGSCLQSTLRNGSHVNEVSALKTIDTQLVNTEYPKFSTGDQKAFGRGEKLILSWHLEGGFFQNTNATGQTRAKCSISHLHCFSCGTEQGNQTSGSSGATGRFEHSTRGERGVVHPEQPPNPNAMIWASSECDDITADSSMAPTALVAEGLGQSTTYPAEGETTALPYSLPPANQQQPYVAPRPKTVPSAAKLKEQNPPQLVSSQLLSFLSGWI